MNTDSKFFLKSFGCLIVAVLVFTTVFAGSPTPQRRPGKIMSVDPKPGEWRHIRNDLAFTGYSTIDQINAGNVKDLKVVWRWEQGSFGPISETGGAMDAEATPIYVDGVLYTTAGSRRCVAAIDPATGETLWTYRTNEPEDRYAKAPRKNSGRGVSFWTDGKGDNRIFLVSIGYYLIALDAGTGQPIRSFGNNGIVDLMTGMRQREGVDIVGTVGSTSPPTIMNDVIVLGPSMDIGYRPPSMVNTPGDVQAFDVRTGQRLWVFHTIPEDGEEGVETWENDSWKYTGNTGVWSLISGDPELGYVYLPVETPTSDFYGGHRPGDNLYGNSIVCLDIRTGRKIWHYQLVHHDIWNYDLPAAPILADIVIDGRQRKIVIQNTKQGFSFVFDRMTGEPIWPIEEVETPQSDVPGEKTSPTQPIPTRPPPWERQGISEEDLVDFTPEIKRMAQEAVKGYRLGPLYTPPSLMTKNRKGTLAVPGGKGGVNWNMSPLDPETGINYICSVTSPEPYALMEPRLDQKTGRPVSDLDYYRGRRRIPTIRINPGDRSEPWIPVVKPPWGRITAIDMKTGAPLWMVPNGDTPEEIKNHPLLKGVDLPPTGKNSLTGSLLTRTLLFAGEGRTGDPKFHAYDKKTGRVVASIGLPAPQTGLPMTFMHDGKQYIVMTVASKSNPAEFVALALPD